MVFVWYSLILIRITLNVNKIKLAVIFGDLHEEEEKPLTSLLADDTTSESMPQPKKEMAAYGWIRSISWFWFLLIDYPSA